MNEEPLALDLGTEPPAKAAPRKRRSRAKAPVTEPASVPTAASAWFITNRYNLLEILSSRLIAPRAAYRQYYKDLLEDVPEGIPIFAAPPRTLLRQVVGEGQNNWPVLLELDSGRVDLADRDVVVLPALPLGAVKRICFPSAGALADHEARLIENILAPPPCEVAEELFEESDTDGPEMVSSGPGTATDWLAVDRVRGAVAAMVTASQRHTIAPAHLSAWIEDQSGALTGLKADQAPTDSAEQRLLRAVLVELDGSDLAASWSPRRLLRSLTEAVGQEDVIARNLEAVRQIVAGERDFAPFKHEDGGALVSAKALLMVLLRPRLEALLNWDRAETNVDDRTLLTAAAMAGRLAGVTRLPGPVRDAWVDDVTSEWACSQPSEGCAVTSRLNEHGTELNIIVISKVVASVAVPEEDATQDEDDDESDGRRARASARTDGTVTTTIRIAGAARLVVDGDALVIITDAPVTITEDDGLSRAGFSGGSELTHRLLPAR